MSEKLQVSLRRHGKALATYPVRVERDGDIIRGLQEAISQFAQTLPEATIGDNGVTLTVEASEASEL